jgi:hypothetical protein
MGSDNYMERRLEKEELAGLHAAVSRLAAENAAREKAEAEQERWKRLYWLASEHEDISRKGRLKAETELARLSAREGNAEGALDDVRPGWAEDEIADAIRAMGAELADAQRERDRVLTLRTRSAYWHGVANMLSSEKYGRPCYTDPDIEAWKVEFTGPLVEAAGRLIERLDAVHRDPEYHGVWAIAQLHRGPYTGLTYTAELTAARAALAPHKEKPCRPE